MILFIWAFLYHNSDTSCPLRIIWIILLQCLDSGIRPEVKIPIGEELKKTRLSAEVPVQREEIILKHQSRFKS